MVSSIMMHATKPTTASASETSRPVHQRTLTTATTVVFVCSSLTSVHAFAGAPIAWSGRIKNSVRNVASSFSLKSSVAHSSFDASVQGSIKRIVSFEEAYIGEEYLFKSPSSSLGTSGVGRNTKSGNAMSMSASSRQTKSASASLESLLLFLWEEHEKEIAEGLVSEPKKTKNVRRRGKKRALSGSKDQVEMEDVTMILFSDALQELEEALRF